MDDKSPTKRNRKDGRYTYTADHLFSCGHRLGDHSADRKGSEQPCFSDGAIASPSPRPVERQVMIETARLHRRICIDAQTRWQCACGACRYHRCAICGAFAPKPIVRPKEFYDRNVDCEIVLHPAGSRVCGRHSGKGRVQYKK